MELFRLLHMPRGTTLEKLNFGHVLNASDEIIRNADALKELNQRAQGEVTIREAIRELDLWGAGAVFTLTEYEDSNKNGIMLIKDWKDLVNQVRRPSLSEFYSSRCLHVLWHYYIHKLIFISAPVYILSW